MGRLTDEMTVPIKCPKCGHETEQSLAWLKDDPTLVCPSCGECFKFDGASEIGDAADELDDLDRAWNKVTKG